MAPASSRLTHKGVVPTAPASDPGNSSRGKRSRGLQMSFLQGEGRAACAHGERRQTRELRETPVQKEETASTLSPGLEDDT